MIQSCNSLELIQEAFLTTYLLQIHRSVSGKIALHFFCVFFYQSNSSTTRPKDNTLVCKVLTCADQPSSGMLIYKVFGCFVFKVVNKTFCSKLASFKVLLVQLPHSAVQFMPHKSRALLKLFEFFR